MAKFDRVIAELREQEWRLRTKIMELEAELRGVTRALQSVEKALAAARSSQPKAPPKAVAQPDLFSAPEGHAPTPSAKRAAKVGSGVPLRERKESLVEYLRKKGRAARGVILAETAMPQGSLSELLKR